MKSLIKQYASMMQQAIPNRDFEIRLWDETFERVGDNPEFVLWFKTRQALAHTISNQFLGFGESFMRGDIAVEGDLRLLLNMGHLMGFGDYHLSFIEKLKFAYFTLAHRNSLLQSRKNIAHHYDVGNDLYELFLDDTLSYTCAYYHEWNQSLETAQVNKCDYIIQKLNLRAGQTLLDIGCGWGGLLIQAAQKHGVKGLGVTLSREQFDFANASVKAAGVQHLVELRIQDYREVEGTFDAVCAIEMLEHVGREYLPQLMAKVKALLKPGKLGLFQFTGNDIPYPEDPWSSKYLFPGLYVPTLSYIVQELGCAEQVVRDVENLSIHYVHTLQEWIHRYEANRTKIIDLYDEEFYYRYQLYLYISLTAYECGGNRLFQVLFSNGLNHDLPHTRHHLYQPFTTAEQRSSNPVKSMFKKLLATP